MSTAEKHFSASDEESKPALLGKKKKKDKEKTGYKMFDPNDSEGEPNYDDQTKAPSSKLKKHGKPSFKFSVKPKVKDKEKEEKRDHLDRDRGHDKKERREHKIKDKDKDKKIEQPPAVRAEVEFPVFGLPLTMAVERNPSLDGIPLPVVVRECIDYIEEHGLLCEGIYRISGVKSKVQHLKDCYNRKQPAYLDEHEPSIVASLLKLFLRELPDPDPVLTVELKPHFEQASIIQNFEEQADQLRQLLKMLPPCNRELLSWMIAHMTHIIAKEKINKMSLQNISIVLSPTMRISHRVLHMLLMHDEDIFSHTVLKRYKAPLLPSQSRWSVELPESMEAIQEEIHRHETTLNRLHLEISRDPANTDREEKLWELQRLVTQLKRKLKIISKTKAAKLMEREQMCATVQRSDPNRRSVNTAELNFALQLPGSLSRQSSKVVGDSSATSSLKRSSAQELSAASSISELVAGSTTEPTKFAQVILTDSTPSSRPDSQPVESMHNVEQQAPADLPAEVPQAAPGTIETPPYKQVVKTEASSSSAMDELAHATEVTAVDIRTSSAEPATEATDMQQEESTPKHIAHYAMEDGSERRSHMKLSASQDSDITLSAISQGMTISLSQSSLQDFPEEEIQSNHEVVRGSQPAGEPETLPVYSVQAEGKVAEPLTVPVATPRMLSALRILDEQLSFQDMSEDLPPEDEACPNTVAEDDKQDAQAESEHEQQSQPFESKEVAKHAYSTPLTSGEILVPEMLHRALGLATADNGNAYVADAAITPAAVADDVLVSDPSDDNELRRLIAEEAQLIWQEEELIAIKDELNQKIATEMIEIERLNEEIIEYEELRSITTQGHSSEAASEDDSYTSTSDTDATSSDEGSLAELNQLVAKFDSIKQQNKRIEDSNAELVRKVHEERMICLDRKIQIRLLQHRILCSSNSNPVQSLI